MQRTIKFIVIHCTATPNNYAVESLKSYWKKTLGWSAPGYHWLIKDGGNRIMLLPEQMISNGVAGFNHQCINIAYIGGIVGKNSPYDTRSEQQKMSIIVLLKELRERYPEAKILGHRDFVGVNKACPCFNAIQEYKDI